MSPTFAVPLGLLSLGSALTMWVAGRRSLNPRAMDWLWPHLLWAFVVGGVIWSIILMILGMDPGRAFGDDTIWWFVLQVLIGGVGLIGIVITTLTLAPGSRQRLGSRPSFLGWQLAWWGAHLGLASLATIVARLLNPPSW